MEENSSFLGKGWSFPPAFNKLSATVEMTSEEADIGKSLEIILTTVPGERVMRPLFGCNLAGKVFEAMNTTEIQQVINTVAKSILLYEPRIDVTDISLDIEDSLEGKYLVQLEFVIRSTNSRRNIVFPFYNHEATEM
ncbi:MAG: GPW/gp25 family protein [Bacteroidota bacterium]